MAGKLIGNRMEVGCRRELMEMLQKLDRSEILEVLSGGFCEHCEAVLEERIHDLINKKFSQASTKSESSADTMSTSSTMNLPARASWGSMRTPESVYSGSHNVRVSSSSPMSVNSKSSQTQFSKTEILLNDGLSKKSATVADGLSEEQREHIRFLQVGRKKDFIHNERINGISTNVVQGLELHTNVFNAEEQKKIVECVYDLQRLGQKRRLRERTYSEPRKWMPGKGRVTIQFGCCYNYAVDKDGNPPGIIREEEVDPLPPLFKQMIKRMVKWHVLPPTCVPNSCIVNIYDEGDCIPPHIDHHDFLRPFCTVSFLTESNILFGSNLKIVDAGEFSGPVSIPLPVGSVLVLKGNGADVAKHCVPAVPAKRISITFRKMDERKLPHGYSPEPELLNIKPLAYRRQEHAQLQQPQHQNAEIVQPGSRISQTSSKSNLLDADNFPPLGGSSSGKQGRQRGNKIGSRQ